MSVKLHSSMPDGFSKYLLISCSNYSCALLLWNAYQVPLRHGYGLLCRPFRKKSFSETGILWKHGNHGPRTFSEDGIHHYKLEENRFRSVLICAQQRKTNEWVCRVCEKNDYSCDAIARRVFYWILLRIQEMKGLLLF